MAEGILKLGEGQWGVKDGNLLLDKEVAGNHLKREFTVTRGTRATYVGKDGLIKESNLQDTNLVTNGTFDTDSDWSGVGEKGWSISNGKARRSGYSVNSDIRQNVAVVNGGTYKFSYTRSYESGDGQTNLYIQLDNANYSTLGVYDSTVVEEHTVEGYFTTTFTGNLLFRIFGISDFTGTIDNVSIQEVKTDTPRIDFTDNTDGHLLLEPESRNLFDYSEDFEPPKWNKSQSELLYGFQSPTGLNTATKITATGSDPYVYRSVNVTQNQTYTFSVYCKGEGSSVEKTARVLFWYGLGTAAGTTTSHEFNLTSGWERVQFQTTPTGSGTLFFRVDVPANSSEVGDVAYIWGAQVEALPYATSYIPTNGSTVTRDAETCTDAGEAQDFNSEEGVLYAEIAALANDGTFRVISLSDGTTSNSLWLYYSSVSNTIQAFDGSTIIAHSIDVTNFIKAAVVYDSNGTRMWVNGSQVGSNTFVGFSGLNKLNFINENESNYNFKGKVKAIKVYKEALSDTELENLTS